MRALMSSLLIMFLSYAGLIVFNASKEILLAGFNANSIEYAVYLFNSFKFWLKTIYVTSCIISWGLIGWYILVHIPRYRIKEVSLLIYSSIISSTDVPTKIVLLFLLLLITIFWLPALCPFLVMEM